MKKTTLLLVALIVGIMVFAQEEKTKNTNEYRTLFSGDKINHGGYGAILMNYSKINDKNAFLAGIRGMWLINHGIGLGIGGYGFINDMNVNNVTYDYTDYSLAGGYGGIVIEPIVGAKHPVHVSFPVLIGAGGVAAIQERYYYTWPHDPEYYSTSSAAYFVAEPGVEIEFNLVKFFRIGLGAYYRYTSNIELLYETWNSDNNQYKIVTHNPDLKGFSFGASLKFGKF
ncbi:MAG: hypothetical protein R2764_07375 [Bacteroidales bacterium]